MPASDPPEGPPPAPRFDEPIDPAGPGEPIDPAGPGDETPAPGDREQ
jgi:hypothetical protein